MEPNSEINEVHIARLGNKYEHVKAYLCKGKRDGRRSYKDYMGSVYKLTDKDKSVTFQSECLIPRNDGERPRVLLLFSNAHPKSIKNGMFHTAEGGIAELWTDLCCVGLFSGDCRIIANPDQLRVHCLEVAYEGRFTLGFACYWLFPTFDPTHLRTIFRPAMEPPGFDDPNRRLDRLLEEWQPEAVISFNKKAFEEFTGTRIIGNIFKRLRAELIQCNYRVQDRTIPIFATYPAAYRFDTDASRLRQDSLRRIANAIQSS